MSQPIHVVIISWQGKHESARHIAAQLSPLAARLTVIASHPEPDAPATVDAWQFLPDAQFFGPKFAAALTACAPDEVMLLVHADTAFGDWAGLIGRCAAAFDQVPGLAVWAPDFTWTPYDTASARLPAGQTLPPGLVPVVQTDAIIAAFSPEVQTRLRQLDCQGNNLGWGIDWAAVAWAFCNARPVLRDTTLRVTHLRSRSYGAGEAGAQMQRFFDGLSQAERDQIMLLHSYFRRRHDMRRPRLARIWRLLRGKVDPLALPEPL